MFLNPVPIEIGVERLGVVQVKSSMAMFKTTILVDVHVQCLDFL